MIKQLLTLTFTTIILAATTQATVIATEFQTQDGFVTGQTGTSTTLGGLVTFSGGQQQQGFLAAAYNNGPAAYLFINSPTGFNGAASTGDTGLISFGGLGATSVSFHAADLANGASTTFRSLDSNNNVLETFNTAVDSLIGSNPPEILTFTAVNGVNIASIEADLPGPAANAPYAASIDTFSATIAVPEPSSTLLLGLAFSASLIRRRR